ncbi:autotransporter outer membrane beta-barrel domain-containing protein [Salmonella enterica subsp. enterica serovar Cerro]|uniref:Autotransporter outer membrane beta-barrel domain-containing protein n=2 Tax=Salmonella enterica TaxID=28901 RepID=A0A5Y3B7D6_SALER|nr:autotransporter outer membrane beta-barrel domain-containing protein [Salmonella enterica]EBP6416581.1 autotransporter outer membrane beta-barrel domain-containing protein [Salmonella enterica subsp. enterica]EDS4903652.1 autotransporter outer membrane beta-barrel domain-containing protein [Salmonella enterica subsp. enterica serovar Mbandaka]EAO5844566.1 autotransporter outer membrane beta-barrel domain-containing protein [Salmonella enterica subsp. enterica serovar Cerro]EAP2443298.1 autot
MNKTYNIIWNAARGMYIVTSELARSGSRAIVSVSASCAVTLLAMDAAPAVAEETRVSIPSQTTTYTLSGATPFVVETDNTIATDTAASAAIVGDNSNDWDLLIESGAVVGSSLTDSQAMNLDSLTGATSVHNQGTITGSNEDGTILLQNGGSVINDALIENSATYEHDPEDIPQEYAGVYMLNGGSYVSSESGVLEGVSGVIVQSGEAHITNGGMINSDGSWRSYGVEFRDGTYGTIVNTGTIITTASDGSNKIEDAAIYVHTLNDMAVSGSVSVDNSGLMQSDFITVALYHGSHFEVVNRVGGVITAGNSSLVGIKSTAMELKVGVDNLVTNDGTISAYGTANTYGIHYGESTSGGVITNTGSITTTGGGAGDASVYVHGNGDGTVVNNSGTMSSTVYGVYLDSARSKGHTLNNQAGSAISANTAVAINGNGNTITNQGKMTGVSDGLLISGNNNIVTTSGGEISGKNGIRVSKGSGNQITAKSGSKITATSTGISIASGNNQVTTESGSAIVAKDNGILINSGANNVTNGGSITATGSSNSYGIQYNSGASGTITNTGTITTTGKGVGDASVYAHGGAVTINNSGTMDSSVFGVYVTTGHTLNNLAGGSITANTAVQLNGNNNTLANAGAILGDTNGVTISGSGNTLTSQGKITGGINAILINSGSKNNTLTLNTGTEISGSITDDNNSASANNNLILDGEGTLGSSISGLNSVTSSGDWTLSGATMNLSGTTNSALWVKSGTLILNGAMTAKGATVDSGTTLQIGNGGTLVATNVEALGSGDVTDNATLELNTGGTFDNVISGSGQVVKSGDEMLTLSGANSYTGGTTISGGTLVVSNVEALGSGDVTDNATLELNTGGDFANNIGGTGSVVKSGDKTLTLSGTNSYTGGTTISGGTLVANNVEALGTGDVTNNATLELNTGGDFTNAISGSGQVVKSGDETLTLSGANSYTGGTTISGGTLVATHVNALGTGAIDNRASLLLDASGQFTVTDLTTESGGTTEIGAGSTLQATTLTQKSDSTLTINLDSNTVDPVIHAASQVSLAGTLDITGIGDVLDSDPASTDDLDTFTLIASDKTIAGDFEKLTVAGMDADLADFITVDGRIDDTGKQYELTTALTWYADRDDAVTDAHGTFNLTNADGSFAVNTVLENVDATLDPASATGWDGTSLIKQGAGTLILNAENTYTGGTTISGGTLVATNVDALGSGDVTDDATLELNTGGTFDNAISGSGQVVKSGDETLTLSGTNSYTGGTTISGGTLVATNVEALGSGDVTDDATLELNTGGTFSNTISGSGQVVKSGDDVLTLSGTNSYSGGTLISDGTLVASNVEALGTGDVTDDAVLELNTGGDFDNAISGSGQVVKSGDETLTLSGSNTYTGGTTISGGTLVASNVEALGTGDVTDNAVLELNTGGDFDNAISGSGQVVKSGDETLTLSGSNTYTGGTLISDGTLVASNVEALGTGDVTNNATLELNTGGTFDNAISGSGQVVKSGDDVLTLSGANSYSGGTLISDGTLVASNVEALGSGDIDNYASLQLNASGQFVTANLTTHDNATTAIGAGSALRANTLTQEANSTLAVHLTDSNSGAIVTADRANLGGTLDITGIGNVTKSWTRDAYAYTLIDTDSAIDSDFAQFTVAGMDAKQVDFLTVDGRVNADDDTRYDVTASLSWYADSDNAATDAHGTFTLSEQGHSFTLNTALTDVDATLNPDSATDWDGKSLIKRGAGTLILGAQNTYSGDTDVQEGALWLAETATIGSAGSAQAVNIAANAAFGGHNATVNGHVNNQGSLYFVDTFTVNGDVVNSSAMISGSDQPNNTLTIAGNYTGNDGHLYLNTQLGDDSSPTDKLIVTGDTAGSTTLHITNVNGLGAQTVNGIEVIEVGGQSDGDFTLYKGHVDINAWTYTLKQDGGDWYLRSESDDVPDDGGDVTPPDDGGDVTPPDDGGDVTPPDDGGDVTPPDDGGEVTPPDDGGDVTPPDDGGDITPPDDGGDITPPNGGGDVTPVTPQYRADIGAYLGNQWMARNLQMQTLYDREGSQYRSADGSVWMRFKAGKAESQAVNGNVDIDSDYSQFQLGGDILTWSDGAQSVTVGLMGSYINASTDSTGNRGSDGSQFSANGSVDGYNLGLYATWFADAQSHRGAYIDSWYQYGTYNNSVDNDGLSASRYDSAAHAVSLETGYRYDIALSNRNTVSLTPQAQVTWQRYSADTVIDDGGTRISGQSDDSWTTRLGVRVDGKLYKESGRIQPFMEVNWLHASDNASATFGDTKVSQDLPNDRVEVKVGIQANVSERLSVYAQAAGQKGKNDYGDASFSLNMRYNW